MEENRRLFGQLPGGALACKIITYGGAVRSLTVPDRDGNPVDVVLGFDTLEDYLAQDKYIGALVGRYANRIGGARFTLNGTEYTLAANDGENSLHGGNVGFDKRVWSVERLTDRAVPGQPGRRGGLSRNPDRRGGLHPGLRRAGYRIPGPL